MGRKYLEKTENYRKPNFILLEPILVNLALKIAQTEVPFLVNVFVIISKITRTIFVKKHCPQGSPQQNKNRLRAVLGVGQGWATYFK